VSTTPTASIAPAPSSESKAWIAGAVVGPLVGIALGAVVWFLLGKRKVKKTGYQSTAGHAEGTYNDLPELASGQHAAEGKHGQADVQPPVYYELGSTEGRR
jgi:hypothetical protein